MERVTAYLIADHVRLHALLDQATRGAFHADAFAGFRAGLLRHIAIEEKLLFPAARVRGAALALAHDLRVEHAALTSLLVPTPDAALCREIGALLAAHDGREEGPDGVYAECERMLSDEESAALTRSAADFPAIRVAPHFDGAAVHRTAAEALTAARRIKRA
jgi:hypothetical protein